MTRVSCIYVIVVILCIAISVSGTSANAAPKSKRIVAIGDLHGDFNHTLIIFRSAGIMDAQGNWVAGDATVVQVGDVLDRGSEGKHIIDLIRNLTQQATAAGGKFITLLGNHELMNIQGLLHYVRDEDYELFGGHEKRYAAFQKGAEYGDWIRQLPLVHKELGTIFVHAGILPEFASMGVGNINFKGKMAMEDADWHNPILGVRGPVWSRTLVNAAQHNMCDELEKSLRMLDAQRMVVGHTPQRTGDIGSFCDGKLLVVDTMISRWIEPKGKGFVKALEITRGPNEFEEPVLHEIEAKIPRGTVADEADGGPKDLDEAMKDTNLLQEMMDLMQEYNARKPSPAPAEEKNETVEEF
eukprot:PhF_6_TR3380/c0_g1_i1/m.4830